MTQLNSNNPKYHVSLEVPNGAVGTATFSFDLQDDSIQSLDEARAQLTESLQVELDPDIAAFAMDHLEIIAIDPDDAADPNAAADTDSETEE